MVKQLYIYIYIEHKVNVVDENVANDSDIMSNKNKNIANVNTKSNSKHKTEYCTDGSIDRNVKCCINNSSIDISVRKTKQMLRIKLILCSDDVGDRVDKVYE